MTLKDDKDRAKTSREELGKFFYGLANATFIGMVIGSMVSMVTDNLAFWPFAYLLSFGLLGTTLLALIANNVLKNK